jgi:hypothetical protein
MDKTLLVCRFNRDVGWVEQLRNQYDIVILQKYDKHSFFCWESIREFQPRLFKEIIDQGKLEDYLKEVPEGFYPNIGVDAHVFFSYICDNYNNLNNITVFTHENPIHHCQDFIKELQALPDDIDFKEFGILFHCDGNGRGEDSGTPVAELYELMFEQPAPEQFTFVSGSLFAVSRDNILQHDINFYQKARDLTLTNWRYPWAFERLYRLIFQSINKSI